MCSVREKESTVPIGNIYFSRACNRQKKKSHKTYCSIFFHYWISLQMPMILPDCKLSSSEISFSFFDRSVFYFEQIIWSTSFRSLILLLLTPPGAPSNSLFFTLIQTSILKNSQPEPTDFLWLMTLFNIYSAKEF